MVIQERVRFVEAGGVEEIARKLKAVRELAAHADEQLLVGGILDSDFRTKEQLAEKAKDGLLFLLPVHEVENFFLHPPAIAVIAKRSGVEKTAAQILVDCADRFAGLWIVHRALVRLPKPGDLHRTLRQAASELTWNVIDGAVDDAVQKILEVSQTEPVGTDQFVRESIAAYKALRLDSDLWKHCMGKEVLGVLPRELGLQSVEALERNVMACWKDGVTVAPVELEAVRQYIDALTAVRDGS